MLGLNSRSMPATAAMSNLAESSKSNASIGFSNNAKSASSPSWRADAECWQQKTAAAVENRGLLPLPLNQKTVRLGRLAPRPGMGEQKKAEEAAVFEAPKPQGLLPRPAVKDETPHVLPSTSSAALLHHPNSLSLPSSPLPVAGPTSAAIALAAAAAAASAALRRKRGRPPPCIRRAVSKDVLAAITGDEQQSDDAALEGDVAEVSAELTPLPTATPAPALKNSLPVWAALARLESSKQQRASPASVASLEAKLAEHTATVQQLEKENTQLAANEARAAQSLHSVKWKVGAAIDRRDRQSALVERLGGKRTELEEALAEAGCKLEMAQAAWLDTTTLCGDL